MLACLSPGKKRRFSLAYCCGISIAVKVHAMNRKPLWLLTVLVLASMHLAEAQQPKKVSRIGFLGATSPSIESTRIEAFRQGMRELGYVEGKNIAIEWRWAEENSIDCPILRPNLCVSMWTS